MMLHDSSSFEIFDVCARSPSELRLLVHVEGTPGEVISYRSVVFKRAEAELSVEYILDTWARTFWKSPSESLYIADMEGGIHSNSAGQWIKTSLGKQHALHNVWGLSEDEIYFSGADALFIRKVVGGWEPFNEGLHGNLFAIGGTSQNDLYVLGEHGSVFHHDGRKWSEVKSPTNRRLVSVLCVSPDEVYFSGWMGLFFRFVGGKWEDFSIKGSDANFYDVVYYGGKVFVGSDEEGVFLFDGRELVSFAPDIEATGLRSCGESLFAFGTNILQEFDGRKWTRWELNFAEVIPAHLP